jgi:hypothetical protein
MRDYLRADEKNQLLIIMMFLDNTEGERRLDGHPIISGMVDEWDKRGILTGSEKKSLKTALTYLKKFSNEVVSRLNTDEIKTINKKLENCQFKMLDANTLEKLRRDTYNKLKNAVVPREQFLDLCEHIMENNCKGCTKNWCDCRLHEIFEDNFIPESMWNKDNCKFSYGEK